MTTKSDYQKPEPRLDENGREILDDTPIVINVRNKRISQFDDVRAFIRRELSDAARSAGAETLEEANDFDIEDDPVDPNTPWEEWGDRDAEDRQREAVERAAARKLKKEFDAEVELQMNALRERQRQQHQSGANDPLNHGRVNPAMAPPAGAATPGAGGPPDSRPPT